MRQTYLIFLAFGWLIASSCLKTSPLGHSMQDALFIRAARIYFTDSVLTTAGRPADYKSGITRSVAWEQATYLKISGAEAVLVPVYYHNLLMMKASFAGDHLLHLDDLTKLLVYRRPGEPFQIELLTAIPDSGYLQDPSASFQGFVYAEDWWGHTLDQYLYTRSGVWKYVPPVTQANAVIRTCNMIYGYNYSTGDPNGAYAWVQTGGCYYMYLPDRVDDVHGGIGGGLGSAGGGLSSSSRGVSIAPPDKPIANISDYIKCFTNTGGSDHTYSVTICVQQPIPGSRSAYKWIDGGPIGSSNEGNIVNVGHTFLIFTEQYGNTIITRNIGFYPATGVKPGSSVSQGKLNNDETHTYNVSATFSVTNANFFLMLNYATIGNNTGFYYNLNSENCTTFALQSLSQGGVTLPKTIGSWPGGMGCNPGDLGEDIKQMAPLPGMIKSTVQNYHPNVGNCL